MKIHTKQGMLGENTRSDWSKRLASSRNMQASRLRTKPAVGLGPQMFEKSKTVRDMSRRDYLFVVKRKKWSLPRQGLPLPKHINNFSNTSDLSHSALSLRSHFVRHNRASLKIINNSKPINNTKSMPDENSHQTGHCC